MTVWAIVNKSMGERVVTRHKQMMIDVTKDYESEGYRFLKDFDVYAFIMTDETVQELTELEAKGNALAKSVLSVYNDNRGV